MGDPRKQHDALGTFLRAIDDSDGEPGGRDLRRSSSNLLIEGRVAADRYRLGPRIARGGMATIWDGFDQHLGRAVALKFMSASYIEEEEYRVRFEEEARAAARLVTPHVCAIYDHGLEDGVPYIVMERLHGQDLEGRLHTLATNGERASLAFASKIATDVGKALKAAHAAGIIHRDLKPKNVFVAADDDGEVIKLLDFGVAKHAGTANVMTATGVMLGSPFYMSPEQIRCERNLDGRTDLWSLGAILYRTVTGLKPFDGDMSAILYKIVRESPPAPSTIVPSLPPAIDAFFLKALARAREDRFQSPTELAVAFRAAVAQAGDEASAVRAISPKPPVVVPNADDQPTHVVPIAELERLAAPATAVRSGLRLSLNRDDALAVLAAEDQRASAASSRDADELPAVLSVPPPPLEPPPPSAPLAHVRPDLSDDELASHRLDAIRGMQRVPAITAPVNATRARTITIAAVALATLVLVVLAIVLATRGA